MMRGADAVRSRRSALSHARGTQEPWVPYARWFGVDIQVLLRVRARAGARVPSSSPFAVISGPARRRSAAVSVAERAMMVDRARVPLPPPCQPRVLLDHRPLLQHPRMRPNTGRP